MPPNGFIAPEPTQYFRTEGDNIEVVPPSITTAETLELWRALHADRAEGLTPFEADLYRAVCKRLECELAIGYLVKATVPVE